jgi:hypothetical protein
MLGGIGILTCASLHRGSRFDLLHDRRRRLDVLRLQNFEKPSANLSPSPEPCLGGNHLDRRCRPNFAQGRFESLMAHTDRHCGASEIPL